ncbi:MAG: hypothetical protein IPL36_03680 [Nigerium sp.]|nr:hypothetical protein [Nigerium sp.]
MAVFASDAARPRLRTRRSPAWLAAGIVAICLGGLGSAYVFTSLTASHSVLQVTRTLHRGELIQPTDLAAIPVGAALDVPTVSEARLGEVVGRAVVSDVPNGSLLVDGSWGEPGVPAGHSRVGLRLPSGRYPATDVRPGTPVLVVALPPPAAGVGAGAEADALPGSVRATLVSAPTAQPDGSFAFDLDVPAEAAEAVARLAAADRVVLVQVEARR